MSDRVKVTFLRPFRAYRRGDVIEMDRGPAKSWVIAGIVAPVEHEQRLIEEATVARQVETADAPRRRRRK